MATPKKQEPDINEEVRTSLRKGLRALIIVVPVLALGWILYILFFDSSPRDQQTTVEATVSAYTELVRPYLGAGGSRPNPIVVDEFLSFFDADSRRFFNDNAEAIARRQFQFEPEKFEELNARERRVQAMLGIVNKPPLNGMSVIREQRVIDGGRTEILVGAVGGTPQRVILKPSGKRWEFENLAGVRTELEAELPRKAETP